MNIALIGPIPPPNGGMAMQTLQLYKLLLSHGHQVDMIAVNAPYKPTWIGRIPLLRAFFRIIPYFYALYVGIKGKDVVHLMANSGWAFHLFVRPAIWMANWCKVPVFINYRGGKARDFFSSAWPYIKKDINSAEKILVPSGFLKDVFAEFGVQATIVPNIINMDLFTFKAPALSSENLHIIVTRNLEEIYDNATAIRAFALVQKQFPKAKLTIAGSGPLASQLVKLVDELELIDSVTFSGRLDREQMAHLYQSADIMINPSTIDNMPNSILEALACGVLVVTTNVGGIPYMVDHQKEAILVEPGKAEPMYRAINSLLKSNELAENIAQAGYEKVQAYQPHQVVPLLEKLYRKVR
ncbi:glycosyltransferase family 4 protein [Candidatus Colwellia aromaticivorans]|uniref:glycosyltransferase family 4 protein n=1 Tax=Candidatus Colwellia aromaticivorans TaxID=2267621 RepID=UPI000DF31680|nr:glycosyltransferase family 4 protein [Candidatus Colwellia aromaticivorans]